MIWYVNSKTGGDANDGRGSGTAFKTLAHAVEVAKAGRHRRDRAGRLRPGLAGAGQLGPHRKSGNVVVSVAGAD
jgi:hypothetical protein